MKPLSLTHYFIFGIYFAFGALAAAEARALTYEIVMEASSLEVHVPKAGLLSFVGHEHTIRAKKLEGRLEWKEGDDQSIRLEVSVPVAGLAVEDEGLGEKDRETVRANMVTEEVLNQAGQPVIQFESKRIVIHRDGKWEISGLLDIGGQSVEINFVAAVTKETEKRIRAKGSVPIKLKTFGISPVKALGGTIRTGDTVEVRFDILTLPAQS